MTGVREASTAAGVGAENARSPARGRTAREEGDARRSTPAAVTAILLATAPAEAANGRAGPAAALPWEDGTLLRRLLAQLSGLGVRSAHVVTRPGWEDALRPSLEGTGVWSELVTSPDTVADLRAIAAVAAHAQGSVLVAAADVVTHREALAGLLADPRVATGVLCTGRKLGHAFAFRVRAVRGRVVSASSPYHAVHRPNLRFLGVLKVAAENRVALADVAGRLASLVEHPLPPGWDQEWHSKHDEWRIRLARLASGGGESDDAEAPRQTDPADVSLSPEDEAVLAEWLATASEDASSLLVVGLVRSQVHVALSHLRELFWARPLSRAAAERAAREITLYDEDRVLLDSAVKANDGFFTTFFVSPYSKYIARWAARRGLTPNQVTVASLAIGLLAAAAFATGERAGLIAGAILLQLSFTTDCVDGQLARYARLFSRLGAWLDSVFDRTKEYVVFAGLAIGASRSGDPVWVLAGSALALQTVRHMIDFSYPVAQHQALAAARQPPLEQPRDRMAAVAAVAETASAEPEEPMPSPHRPLGERAVYGGLAVWRALNRWAGARWLKKIIAFPIGERFAVISIVAAVASARTTFVVLLAWGGFAAVYKMLGRVLRSAVR